MNGTASHSVHSPAANSSKSFHGYNGNARATMAMDGSGL
eukprot:CAMPEP_0119381550 /NCGR_PEP_ID=MMETSP1334-20130426/65591_1 /TAXON_ID=127549 /ORGANISM="Calcidiscus leptoporus, Strain RCC1130" /LENGTH=38 /DNA_ID= /DNA_START= /DNA_END= /DNA_ORIENTATION=